MSDFLAALRAAVTPTHIVAALVSASLLVAGLIGVLS